MRASKYYIFFILCLVSSHLVFSQDDIWENLLKEEVAVINPVYKPVLGIGMGVFNFYGDVKSNQLNSVIGNAGYKINVHTYIDKNKFYKANFYLLYGNITANQRSFSDASKNKNFSSDIIVFGINSQYDFKHLLPKETFLRPFISLGVENINFNPKGDLRNDATGEVYHYFPDGSIRNTSQNELNPLVVQRDYVYETDLREADLYGYGNYSRNTFAIPVELGFDFNISYRFRARLAYSYHFTFSDVIDSYKYSAITPDADSKKDNFSYAYVSMNFDLFSDPKSRMVEKLFADIDFDYAMYGDEDEDMVFDGWDDCPYTPKGVAVDTLGCPYDTDGDGIPDFKDLELATPADEIVDADGIAISEDKVILFLSEKEGVSRKDVDTYLKLYASMGSKRFVKKSNIPIPGKFLKLDVNKDKYISYDELIKSIDNFFDFESDFSNTDIYELMEFFFIQ